VTEAKTIKTVFMYVVLGIAVLTMAVGVTLGYSHNQESGWYLAILGSGLIFCGLAFNSWDTGKYLFLLGALTTWMFAAGVSVDIVDRNNTFGLAPVAIGIFGSGVVVFFGVLGIPPADAATAQGRLSDLSMRNAIGASLLVFFAGILVFGIFHDVKLSDEGIGKKFADELVHLFELVVAFYFTTTATVETLKYWQKQKTVREGTDPGGHDDDG
jgi:MFS family permease